MKNLVLFFWLCSGADVSLLKKCPSEKTKYVGIGATVFFTGMFAAFAAGYALQTVFDNLWIAISLGILWGLMIFNLDRYIVSSMRKEGKLAREFLLALPRIVLAVIISVVIAKPLELKIFEKEIQPELNMMEQQAYAREEQHVELRFRPTQDSLKQEIAALKKEIELKAMSRDDLARIAQEEADGTGGSKRRNLGPIYKVKKADADRAEKALQVLMQENNMRIVALEKSIYKNDSLMKAEVTALDRGKLNGLASRLEALHRIMQQSDAVFWANAFIILLFIALETAPILVKLISPKGPYDNLLKIEEHHFATGEVEDMAITNSGVKQRTTALGETERRFINEQLDAALKQL